MPVGDSQRTVMATIAEVSGLDVVAAPSFSWLTNTPLDEAGEIYDTLGKMFDRLGGNRQIAKRTTCLPCDAYLPAYNCILEFDEFQHFSKPRLTTLRLYPADSQLGFDKSQYQRWCEKHRRDADRYRRTKRTTEFDFEGGRTAQRAFFDACKDLLPSTAGLGPTLRISEFEVGPVVADDVQFKERVKVAFAAKLETAGLTS